MRRAMLAAIGLLFLTAPAMAQDGPKAEIGTGLGLEIGSGAAMRVEGRYRRWFGNVFDELHDIALVFGIGAEFASTADSEVAPTGTASRAARLTDPPDARPTTRSPSHRRRHCSFALEGA